MEKNYVISVIIPTYRPQVGYLAECLRALNAQRWPSPETTFEVLLVLNGERHPYQHLIEGILDTCHNFPFRLIYCERAGVSNARNLGIDSARGKYIAFIDDDDYISEDYLYVLWQAYEQGKSLVAYLHKFDDGMPPPPTPPFPCPDRGFHLLRKRFSLATCCNRLYHRQRLGAVRFVPGMQNGEDSIFAFESSYLFGSRLYFDPRVVYFRRRRYLSLSDFKNRQIPLSVFARVLWGFLRVYFSHPMRYSFLYFLTRILAVLRGYWGAKTAKLRS